MLLLNDAFNGHLVLQILDYFVNSLTSSINAVLGSLKGDLKTKTKLLEIKFPTWD